MWDQGTLPAAVIGPGTGIRPATLACRLPSAWLPRPVTLAISTAAAANRLRPCPLPSSLRERPSLPASLLVKDAPEPLSTTPEPRRLLLWLWLWLWLGELPPGLSRSRAVAGRSPVEPCGHVTEA